MSKADKIALSVILPSFNAADVLLRNVPVLLGQLEHMKLNYEIIISDDGSQDGGETRRAAEVLGCIYTGQPANKGKGAAVRLGMRTAQGRVRVYTDADIPFEVTSVDRMWWYLDSERFDVAVGDRMLAESLYYEEIAPLRRTASRFYSAIASGFVTGGRYDTQCGLKGFRAEVAEDLFDASRIDGFAFDVELLRIALNRHYRIVRLPVRLRSQDGTSVDGLRDALRMVFDLAVIRWKQLTGQYRRFDK